MVDELKLLLQRKIILVGSLMKMFKRDPISIEYANAIDEAYSFYVDFLEIITKQGYVTSHQLKELDRMSESEFKAVGAIARERGLI